MLLATELCFSEVIWVWEKGDGTDTWNWSGRYWTQMGKNGPSDRFNAAIAFDGEKVILHGGYKNLGTGIWFNETWSWDGQDWTKLNDQVPFEPAM
ncbi:MAG: hypothetical protein IPM82_26050 [Saprospiraceae bacterium]|nr:hypothetical protein [Saprospiraceae bacterium]